MWVFIWKSKKNLLFLKINKIYIRNVNLYLINIDWRDNANSFKIIISHLSLIMISFANRNINRIIFWIICRCYSLIIAIEACKNWRINDLIFINFIIFMFFIFIVVEILNSFLAKNIIKNFFNLMNELFEYIFYKD